jgi:hypothetical protein
MDGEGVGAVASDRLKNGIGGLGPDKRLGVVVVSLDEGGDVGLQRVDAALDLSVGEQREPALYLVQPRRTGRREVAARVPGQPGFDWRRLVGGVIVELGGCRRSAGTASSTRGQELAEFDRAVPLVAAADDPAGGDVQSGKQRSGAVALVIMAPPLGLSRSHRQQRLGAVKGLDLRLSRRRTAQAHVRESPTMLRTLSTNNGSCDSLKVSTRCGCKPKARQMRPTLEVELPLRRAMLRVLQCLASGGWLSSVCTMTLSTLASSIWRGAPGRGSSSRPSRPRSTKRRRHLPTVCGVTRSRAAIALLLRPAGRPSTIRARNAKACAVLRRCA